MFPRFHPGFSYLDAWFRALRSRSLAPFFPSLKLRSCPAEIRALRNLETFVRVELKQRAGCEASIYRRYGITEGFSRIHAEEAMIVSGLAQNEGEAMAAWEELVRQDRVKQSRGETGPWSVVRYDYNARMSVWRLRKREERSDWVLLSQRAALPAHFDVAFFFAGIKRMLEQEHVLVGESRGIEGRS